MSSVMQPMQHADMMILWNSRVGMITADDVERALGIDRRNASNLLSAMQTGRCVTDTTYRVGDFPWPVSRDVDAGWFRTA